MTPRRYALGPFSRLNLEKTRKLWPSFKGAKTSPYGYLNGSLMHAQAVLRNNHPRLKLAHLWIRLKQQQLRSKDGIGKGHENIPILNYLPVAGNRICIFPNITWKLQPIHRRLKEDYPEQNLAGSLACLGLRAQLRLEQRLLRFKDGNGLWQADFSSEIIMEVHQAQCPDHRQNNATDCKDLFLLLIKFEGQEYTSCTSCEDRSKKGTIDEVEDKGNGIFGVGGDKAYANRFCH